MHRAEFSSPFSYPTWSELSCLVGEAHYTNNLPQNTTYVPAASSLQKGCLNLFGTNKKMGVSRMPLLLFVFTTEGQGMVPVKSPHALHSVTQLGLLRHNATASLLEKEDQILHCMG